MKFELKGNKNYCATIIKIDNIIPLPNCDNIYGTLIFGNHVIIPNTIKLGDKGIFFPVETCIAQQFLAYNNLYRDKFLNTADDKVGFFDQSGRVKCVKLRGYKSEGFWMPLTSLAFIMDSFTDVFTEGIEFDHINDKKICEKYVIKSIIEPLSKKDRINNKINRFNKLIENQFRFHIDTEHFGKNTHKFELEDIISITEKLHGTSFVVSNILCNRKLTWKDKIAKFFGAEIKNIEYDNIYASRKMIKNQYLYDIPHSNYYTEDIWKVINEELKSYLIKGMTIYGECVGFLKDGGAIQSKYDYGCKPKQHENYIYRITTTDEDGNVFEWPFITVKQWCKKNKLKSVPLHYYGTVEEFIKTNDTTWLEQFINTLNNNYLEKNCSICHNKVPSEGICIRKESLDIEVYKFKSFKFKELETKLIDKGEFNIEDN